MPSERDTNFPEDSSKVGESALNRLRIPRNLKRTRGARLMRTVSSDSQKKKK
jgi:hypothetical protein